MTAKLSTTVETILWHACRKAGKCSSSCFALIDGSRVSREQTLMSTEIENGEEIIVLTERLGGKPVIYLHSPDKSPHPSSSRSYLNGTSPSSTHRSRLNSIVANTLNGPYAHKKTGA